MQSYIVFCFFLVYLETKKNKLCINLMDLIDLDLRGREKKTPAPSPLGPMRTRDARSNIGYAARMGGELESAKRNAKEAEGAEMR